MNIQFWSIGKAHESFVNEGILLFTKRISHYYNIQWQLISNIKNAANLHVDSLKIKEGELVTSMLKKMTTWYYWMKTVKYWIALPLLI